MPHGITQVTDVAARNRDAVRGEEAARGLFKERDRCEIMATNMLYVEGMIAAKENSLLGEKIYRMCEVSADDAFRMLSESGFGAGEMAASAHDYEKLIIADEATIDEFIREYSPNKAISQYLLAPRDFHNAKAMVKAEYTSSPLEPMLAPDGLITREDLEKCFSENDFSVLPAELGQAITEARAYLSGSDVKSAYIGVIFDKALFCHLIKECKGSKTLRKFISMKADMQNVLTALRSPDYEEAKAAFVNGGKLSADDIEKVVADVAVSAGAGEGAAGSVGATGKTKRSGANPEDDTALGRFLKLCRKAKAEGKPLTEAEKYMSSFEEEIFFEKKYELSSSEPFLYYVFRRRAENENVRIVFVCLLNGFSEADIKARLRSSL